MTRILEYSPSKLEIAKMFALAIAAGAFEPLIFYSFTLATVFFFILKVAVPIRVDSAKDFAETIADTTEQERFEAIMKDN